MVFAETMVNLGQELSDCDLCVEFAHFLSNFITLKRKKTKLTKTKTLCLAMSLTQMYPLFR